MNDTPEPTPAIRETPSATYRKGQMSVVAKVLVLAQAISLPVLGWMFTQWNAVITDIAKLNERNKVNEIRLDQQDRGFGELKEYLQRVEEKLDRLLMERRP